MPHSIEIKCGGPITGDRQTICIDYCECRTYNSLTGYENEFLSIAIHGLRLFEGRNLNAK